MKIIVLAGGTSTEREISIVSGTQVTKALRERGHQAVLVDVFCGLEGADPETVFDGPYDVDKAAAYMRAFDAALPEMIRTRKRFFGPAVLELVMKGFVSSKNLIRLKGLKVKLGNLQPSRSTTSYSQDSNED